MKGKEQSKQDDDSITLDISSLKKHTKNVTKSVTNFYNTKHGKIIITWLLIALIIFISSWYRLYPMNLDVTEDWARNTIETNVKSQLATQVRGEQTSLPDATVNQRVNEQYALYYSQNKDAIEQQVQSQANVWKAEMKDENGQTYLLAIDPYLWYSYAKLYEKNGYWGNEVVDGKESFSLRNGRIAADAKPNMPSVAIIFIHNVISIFNPNQNILNSAFLMPPILIGLAIIPAFFLGRKIGGLAGGFFSATIFALAPTILGRTSAGFSDTDAYTFIFPFLIVWLFLESLEAKNTTKNIILSLATALSIVLFRWFWGGWWFTFDLIIGLAGIFILYKAIILLIKHKKKFKIKKWLKDSKAGWIFLILFIIFSLLFTGTLSVIMNRGFVQEITTFARAPLQPIEFVLGFKGAAADIGIGSSAGTNYPLWPNVFTTVAELNPGNFNQVIGGGGGTALVLLSLIGIILVTIFKRKDGKSYPLYGILLAVWFVSTYWAGFIGQRFISLFAPVVAFGVAGFIGTIIYLLKHASKKKTTFAVFILISMAIFYAIDLLIRLIGFLGLPITLSPWIIALIALIVGGSVASYTTEKLKVHFSDGYIHFVAKVAIILFVFGFILYLMIPQMQVANSVAKSEVPSYDDTWERAMITIQNSSEKAIISSWWDFGHWFQARSERMVTFDGGDQGKRIHWIGKTLLTEDEDEALDILTMLNCGQEESYNLLEEELADKLEATRTLKKIIRMNKDEARDELLSLGVSESKSEEVLEFSHCEDLYDMYYITSSDMIGKATVWGHFGSWDFDRAYAYYKIKNMPIQEALNEAQTKLNLNEDEAKNIYKQIQSIVTEDQANAWISPWPSYITGSPVSCSEIEEENVLLCDYNRNLGAQNGIVTNLWRAVINMTDIEQSFIILRGLDQSTGSVSSQTTLKPASIIDVEDNFKEYTFENPGIQFSITLFQDEAGNYKTLLADPLLADSMFTKLYFLDGKGTEHFDKVFDQTDFRGTRVVVWKVNP